MSINIEKNIEVINNYNIELIINIYNEILGKIIEESDLSSTRILIDTLEETVELLEDILDNYDRTDKLPDLRKLKYLFIDSYGRHIKTFTRDFDFIKYDSEEVPDSIDLNEALLIIKEDLTSAYIGRTLALLLLFLITKADIYMDKSVESMINKLNIPEYMIKYNTFNGSYNRGKYKNIEEDILNAIEEAKSNEEIRSHINRVYNASVYSYKDRHINRGDVRIEITTALYINYNILNRLRFIPTVNNKKAYLLDYTIKDSLFKLVSIAVNEFVNILVYNLQEDDLDLPLTYVFRKEVLAIADILGITDLLDERISKDIIEVDESIKIDRIQIKDKIFSRGW